jgi:uncharacterized caspase-like protein
MSNTLIAFATKPNAIAEDGRGPHSPFTTALVKHLLTPGLDLRIALGYVRDEVLTSTASKQEPYVTGSLGGGIVSISADGSKPTSPSPAALVAPTTEAARAWAAAKDSSNIAVLEAFRRQFGTSNPFYNQLATARIEKLKGAKADAEAQRRQRAVPTARSAQRSCDERLRACYRMCDVRGVGDCRGSCDSGRYDCEVGGGVRLCTRKGVCF